jgi:hypothetical protein
MKEVDENVFMYKNIMAKMMERNPMMNPDVFFSTQMPVKDFSLLDETHRMEEFKKQGGDLFLMVRDVLGDEAFMCEISDFCECDFMDIFKCLYSYYGNLLFKKPQFSRWVKKTVMAYTDDTKRYLSIPLDGPEAVD